MLSLSHLKLFTFPSSTSLRNGVCTQKFPWTKYDMLYNYTSQITCIRNSNRSFTCSLYKSFIPIGKVPFVGPAYCIPWWSKDILLTSFVFEIRALENASSFPPYSVSFSLSLSLMHSPYIKSIWHISHC